VKSEDFVHRYLAIRAVGIIRLVGGVLFGVHLFSHGVHVTRNARHGSRRDYLPVRFVDVRDFQ
jgi:hypothetical protein